MNTGMTVGAALSLCLLILIPFIVVISHLGRKYRDSRKKYLDSMEKWREWQVEHAAIIKTCRNVQASIRETRKLAEAIMQREKEHPNG